jgi:thioredoxin 1
MEIQQQRGVGSSKVVKVQNEEAWELFTNQASNEGRPVGSPSFPSSSPTSLPLPSCFLLVSILLNFQSFHES